MVFFSFVVLLVSGFVFIEDACVYFKRERGDIIQPFWRESFGGLCLPWQPLCEFVGCYHSASHVVELQSFEQLLVPNGYFVFRVHEAVKAVVFIFLNLTHKR